MVQVMYAFHRIQGTGHDAILRAVGFMRKLSTMSQNLSGISSLDVQFLDPPYFLIRKCEKNGRILKELVTRYRGLPLSDQMRTLGLKSIRLFKFW